MPQNYVSIAVVAGLAISTTACHKPDQVEIQQLRWLDSADPIADAKNAISKGDYKLRAVLGLGIFVPGTESIPYESIEKLYGYTIIEGTSDSLVNEEHHRLEKKAYAYAEAYNRYIIQGSKIKGHQ